MARAGPGEAGRQARGVGRRGVGDGRRGAGCRMPARCLVRPPSTCPAASALLDCRPLPLSSRVPWLLRADSGRRAGPAAASAWCVVGGGSSRRKAARAATVKRGAVRERPYSVPITESASPSRPKASRSSASRDRDRRHGRSAPGPPGCRGRAGSRPDILLMQEMEPSGRLRLDHLQVARVATGSLHRCAHGRADALEARVGERFGILAAGAARRPRQVASRGPRAIDCNRSAGRTILAGVGEASAGGAVPPPTGSGAASAQDGSAAAALGRPVSQADSLRRLRRTARLRRGLHGDCLPGGDALALVLVGKRPYRGSTCIAALTLSKCDTCRISGYLS